MQKQTLDISIKSPPQNNLVVIDKSNPLGKSFLNYLHSRTEILVFSAHLDDAVLSMGSLITYISQKDIPVKVITLFADGSDVTGESINKMVSNGNCTDTKSYFKARRAEDIIALKELGKVDVTHMYYIDAAWRSDKEGQLLYTNTTNQTIKEDDYPLFNEIINKIKETIKPTETTGIFGPVARGRHIDHQLLRNMVNEVFPSATYYEDFPYSSYFENEDDFLTKNNLKPVEWKGDYEAKKRAILQYKTQYVSLFGKGPMVLPYERYYITDI